MPYSVTVLLIAFGLVMLMFGLLAIASGAWPLGIIILLISLIMLFYGKIRVSQFLNSYKMHKAFTNDLQYRGSTGFMRSSGGVQDILGFSNSLKLTGAGPQSTYSDRSSPFIKNNRINTGRLAVYVILMFLVFFGLWYAFIFLLLFSLLSFRKPAPKYASRQFLTQSNLAFEESDGVE